MARARKYNTVEERMIMWEVIKFIDKRLPDDEGIYIGLDLSYRSTGYAVLEKGKLIDAGTFGSQSKDGTERQRDKIFFDNMVELLEKYKPVCVGVEQVSVARNIQSMIDLSRLLGALNVAMETVVPNAMRLELVSTQIKKAACGNGFASKDEVMLGVDERFGHLFSSSDMADAFVAGILAASFRSVVQSLLRALPDNFDEMTPQERSKILLDAVNMRLYDPEVDVQPREVYETLMSTLKAQSVRVVRDNDTQAYYNILDLVLTERKRAALRDVSQ